MTASGHGILSSLSLRTPRMLLRPWHAEDRREFVRVHEISADFYRPWTAAAVPGQSLDQLFDRSLEQALAGMHDGTHLRLIGEMLHDRRIAGFFSLSEIVRGIFQSAYAGWRVSVDVAGQGLATEGVAGLLDLGFAPPPHGIGLHRIQANVIPGNAASLRVAEKCGFRREGLASRYLKIAGVWQDHVMFARTAEEHRLRFLEAHV